MISGTTRLRSAICLLAALLLSGCAALGNLEFWSDDDEADRPMPLPDIRMEVVLKREWGANVGKGLGERFARLTPTLLADLVIAADAFGSVAAFERFSGKRRWRTRIEPSDEGFGFGFGPRRDAAFVSAGVAAGEGIVVVGTSNGEVIALDAANGGTVWRVAISSEAEGKPVIGGGLVYIGAADGRLAALDVLSGKVRWNHDSQVPVLTLRGGGAVNYVDGVVYAPFANGKLIALNSEDGEILWEHRMSLSQGRSELDRIIDVDSSAEVLGRFVYSVNYNGNLKSLRRSDGTSVWEMKVSSYLPVATGYGNVYVVDDQDALLAVDQREANVLWRQESLLRRALTAPTAVSSYLAVGDMEGYVHLIAQTDGRLVGRVKAGRQLFAPLLFADGLLYCFDSGGKLTAFSFS
ncbi:MAG: outer membrane protein assembly factor BamB [Gammaproteobacteria bacterium]|nr:outer membrane protein assembly factor BamB [Gammaproteobacteria bacterium]